MNTAKKIHIIGSVASGKSTLARQLSSERGIHYYELDHAMWRIHPDGDSRNTEAQRRDILISILNRESWIIEGVHYQEWMYKCLEEAELIIFLDTPKWKRNYRILKRYVEEKYGFKEGNYKQTFTMLRKMYGWSRHYERKEKPIVMGILDSYQDKVIIQKG
ncbi:DNA topology modulation protein FlaR [Rossellomorea aquimaris]|nr:DNA topology modulation protein FlaR [Rossellomorea aquimaris]WRP04623.1 DNA topology modulation protein FlaR [Rossellomorea aquimaris]